MSDRYTSPALSRDLAAAGLEQRVIPGNEVTRYWWLHSKVLGVAGDFGAKYLEPGTCARALDLTDCLHEIRKHMQLSRERILMTDDGETCDVRIESVDADWMERASGKSLVEAAGLVLVEMLRERPATAADIDLSMRRSMDGERAKP